MSQTLMKDLMEDFIIILERINNGLIKNGHNVLNVSDRDIISNYRSLNDPNGIKILNKKIIANFENFKPDLIVLGHSDNVSNETLNQ